ncbi:uncharacterized protein [Eurosta solidaginis]|uniref:uncharacterized protein n=1 Tax=Eurosta solidaginis TaxID=178769 RepID=UPI0035317239
MDTRQLPGLLSKQKLTAKLFYGHRMSNVISVLLLISMLMMLQMPSVYGLLCYTCTYREQDIDNTCLVDANSTRITNCSKKYCTIMRQETVFTWYSSVAHTRLFG